jgi:predicted Zn-dependent peptidase
MSSRLFQEVRENLGLAYSIYAFNYTHLDSGIFGIYAGTTPEKTNELLKATCKETLKICEKITDKELQRVRTQFEASLLMSKESTNSRSQRLGSDVLSYGRLISDKEILDKVFSVKKSDVTKMAEKIFSNSKPTFAAIGKVKDVISYEKILKELR